MVMSENAFVTLHYRLALAQVEVEESFGEQVRDIVNTFTGTPATLQLGSGQWSPFMEAKIQHLQEGERAVFELTPQEGFGDRNAELVQYVSLALLKMHVPADSQFNPGDIVEFPMPEDSPYAGGKYTGVLKSVDAKGAWFDFNHPLAGKCLELEVEIIGIL